jgi:dGTPase
VDAARRAVKNFLYENVYYSPTIKADKEDGEQVIGDLFGFFMASPNELPHSYQEKLTQDPLNRVVCDYIAGMTDSYVREQHRRFCG